MDDATGNPSLESRHRTISALVDSVSTLARLIAEEAQTEEKIHASQAALAAVKRKISESLVQSYITRGTDTPMPEDLMRQEQYYERLLLALQEMKRDIAQRIRPLELQIIEANRDHLHEIFRDHTRKLMARLAAIDEHIVSCRKHLDEYRKIRGELEDVNEKLSQLGTLPLDIPQGPLGGDLGELLQARLAHLKAQGKI